MSTLQWRSAAEIEREKQKKATREVRADRREVHLSLPVGKTWSEGVVSGMTVGECTELCVYVYMTAARRRCEEDFVVFPSGGRSRVEAHRTAKKKKKKKKKKSP